MNELFVPTTEAAVTSEDELRMNLKTDDQTTTLELPVLAQPQFATQSASVAPQVNPQTESAAIQGLAVETSTSDSTTTVAMGPMGLQANSYGGYSIAKNFNPANEANHQLLSKESRTRLLAQKLLQESQAQALSILPAPLPDNHANFYQFPTTPRAVVLDPYKIKNPYKINNPYGDEDRYEDGNSQAESVTRQELAQGSYPITSTGLLDLVPFASLNHQSEATSERQSSNEAIESIYQPTIPKTEEPLNEGIDSSAEDTAAEVFDANDADGGSNGQQSDDKVITVDRLTSMEITKGETPITSTAPYISGYLFQGSSVDQVEQSDKGAASAAAFAPLLPISDFSTDDQSSSLAQKKSEEPKTEHEQQALVEYAPIQVSQFSAMEGDIDSVQEQGEESKHTEPKPILDSFFPLKKAQIPQLAAQRVHAAVLAGVGDKDDPNSKIPETSDANEESQISNSDAASESSPSATPSYVPKQVGTYSNSQTLNEPLAESISAPMAHFSSRLRNVLSNKAPDYPPLIPRYELDPEKCKQIKNLAEAYLIPDAIEWIQKNCEIAKLYFPTYTCEQMRQYVSSCYQMRML